jgi:hypothetical protein
MRIRDILLEANADIFSQRDITQKSNISKLLGFTNALKKVAQGSFATLYQHPKYKEALIKVTSHKEDIQNLIRAQRAKSNNIVKLYDWEDGSKFKAVPSLKSWAVIVERIDGSPMQYTTNHFYMLAINGNYELAKDWMDAGGSEEQQQIMELYGLNNNQEHIKLAELFETLDILSNNFNIDLSDFEDNIIDNGSRYVMIDMGF